MHCKVKQADGLGTELSFTPHLIDGDNEKTSGSP
jgi:hypothetical protein